MIQIHMPMFATRFLACFIVFLGSGLGAQAHTPPYSFVPNQGQWQAPFAFKAELPSGAVFFTSSGWTYHWADFSWMHQHHIEGTHADAQDQIIQAHALSIRPVKPLGDFSWQGEAPLKSTLNFMYGQDPSRWKSNIHPYERIQAWDVWQGVAVRFLQQAQGIKYEFYLEAGVQPDLVQLEISGAESLSLVDGRLRMGTSLGPVFEEAPVAYQVAPSGDTLFVACAFNLRNRVLGFDLGAYRKDLPLTIDPSLVFGSYSGSTADNWGYTATYDALGFLYTGGIANGIGFPTSIGAYQTTWNGGHGTVFPSDLAISKYDTTGSFMVWSTYLGGSGSEVPHSMVVNSFNELFIYGTTGSADYPVSSSAYDPSFNAGTPGTTTSMNIDYNSGSDIFISRLSAQGDALLASTFIGGTGNDGLNQGAPLRFNYADEVRGEIIIDNLNNIYVATVTASNDFPVTNGAFQTTFGGGQQDGVVLKMDNSLTTMIWASYLGGSLNDGIYSLDLYANNDLLVTGGTNSQNFPTANTPFNTYAGGISDGFVSRFSSDGTTLLNSMLVGSPDYDQSYFVQLDGTDHIYTLGQTNTPGNFWIQNATFNIPNSGQFIRKYAPDFSSIVWSTAFGTGDGNPDISPSAFLVDVCNKIYLSGWGGLVNASFFTGSTTAGMPITPGTAFQTTTDGSDYYLMVIDDNANQLIYGSFYGGPNSGEHVDGGTSRFDRKGVIYQSVCAGCGGFSDFPTSPNAHSQTNNALNCNNGVFKFSFDFPSTIADFLVPNSVCLPSALSFQNTSAGATNYLWDFGDGNSSTQTNPSHVYGQSGVYNVTLFAFDNTGSNCNPVDSITRQVVVLDNAADSLAQVVICLGDQTPIGIPPNGDPTVTYAWTPSAGLSDSAISNPIASPSSTQVYSLVLTNSACSDTLQQVVVVETLPNIQDTTLLLCPGQTVVLQHPDLPGNASPSWSPTAGLSDSTSLSPSVTPTSDQTYTLIFELGTCRDTLDYILQVDPSPIIDLPELVLCPGDTIALNQADTTGRTNFQWTPTTGLSNPGVPFPNAWPSSSQNYILTAQRGACLDTFRQPVKVLDPTAFAGADKLICFGDQVPIGSTDTLPGFQYQWTPSSGLSSDTVPRPLAGPNSPTTYVLQTFLPGFPGVCERIDSVFVDVQTDLPLADFDWQEGGGCLGMKLSLSDLSSNSDSVAWYINGNPLAPGSNLAEFPYDSAVTLTQVVWNGPCRDSLSKPFAGGAFSDYLSFDMPNVFTPVISPGINDVFCPIGLENEYCFTLWIYNRWGTRIFQSTGSKPCWDGTIGNTTNPASEGVYYWVLLLDDNVTERQGMLHLFRTSP